MLQSRISKDTLTKAQALLNKLMDQNVSGKAMQQAIFSNSSSPSSPSSQSSASSTLSMFSTLTRFSSESKEKIGDLPVDISKDKHDLAMIDYLKGQRSEVLNVALGLALEKKHVRACALLLSVNDYYFVVKEIFDYLLLPAGIRHEITR